MNRWGGSAIKGKNFAKTQVDSQEYATIFMIRLTKSGASPPKKCNDVSSSSCQVCLSVWNFVHKKYIAYHQPENYS